MTDLTIEVVTHYRCESVVCCAGGELWEEQFVAVVLFAKGVLVGDLCPRCLSRPPAEAARRYLAAADHVRGLLTEQRDRSGAPLLDGDGELLNRLSKLKLDPVDRFRVSRLVRVLGESGRLRDGSIRKPADQNPTLPPNLADGTDPPGGPLIGGRESSILVAEQADELTRLADRLAALKEWPTTVDRVIEAERLAVIGRYALASKDLRRAVDDRYAAFLAGSG